MLGIDKNNVIVNYLLSYLSKGLSKVKDKQTTKKKKKINFLLEDADSLKISVFYLFRYNIFTEAHCVMIGTMSTNKT